jgi:hypothetical protein
MSYRFLSIAGLLIMGGFLTTCHPTVAQVEDAVQPGREEVQVDPNPESPPALPSPDDATSGEADVSADADVEADLDAERGAEADADANVETNDAPRGQNRRPGTESDPARSYDNGYTSGEPRQDLRDRDERRSREDSDTFNNQQPTIQSAADLDIQLSTADDGLEITRIDRNSYLINSGLQQGDVLVSAQGRPLRSEADFVRWFGRLQPRARVPIIVLRDGRRETIYVTGWRRDYRSGDVQDMRRPSGRDAAYLGVVFDDRYPRLALVEVVRRGTAAEQAGLRAGDTIQQINGRRVTGLQQATQLISELRPGDEIELVFSRRVTDRATVALGARPSYEQATYDDYSDSEYSSERVGTDDSDATDRVYNDDPDSPRESRMERSGRARPFRNP